MLNVLLKTITSAMLPLRKLVLLAEPKNALSESVSLVFPKV